MMRKAANLAFIVMLVQPLIWLMLVTEDSLGIASTKNADIRCHLYCS